MSNLPKAVTFIAIRYHRHLLGRILRAHGAGRLRRQDRPRDGGLPHYQELGAAYQKALEPYGVDVQMRPAVEGFKTLKGLVANPPEFDAAFIKGGLVGSMQGRLARSKAQEWQQKEIGKLRSLGRLFYEPIWVFVRSDFAGQSLRDLRGQPVLTGTSESGTRRIAGQLMRANGLDVGRDNPLMIAEDLAPDGGQLLSGKAHAAFLIQPADSEVVQKLLHVEGIRLLNFALEADAYANRFPALTKVMLNRGAVEFEPLMPADDITLLATSTALVVRADLEPSLINLLSFAVLNNPRSGFDKAGDPVLFHRPGTFPHISDPEFQVPQETRLVYKTGELPVALRSIAPAVKEAGFSYQVTGFIADHGAQTVLLLIPLARDPASHPAHRAEHLCLVGAAAPVLLVPATQDAGEAARPSAGGRPGGASGGDRADRHGRQANPLSAQFLRSVLSLAAAHQSCARQAVPEAESGADGRRVSGREAGAQCAGAAAFSLEAAPKRPNCSASVGSTKRFRAIELISPPTMTSAMGPSISRPGSFMPMASGRRPSAVTIEVMRIGDRRSAAPEMAASGPIARRPARRGARSARSS